MDQVITCGKILQADTAISHRVIPVGRVYDFAHVIQDFNMVISAVRGCTGNLVGNELPGRIRIYRGRDMIAGSGCTGHGETELF